MKLLIAIPALNEEASIESIIERSWAAREHIIAHSPVRQVEVTVVSDGSTDRTVERARRYTDRIRLIVFEQNRGYGAAIKAAWNETDADLLGFLDADGTCDPAFFADLCTVLEDTQADIVLGSRLNAGSRMPMIRRIGNRVFASLLTLFSSERVRDTASGMRVVRRSCLPELFPLPDGLHFTPAMSARAMLSANLKIAEVPMPYHEREGASKLRVVRDGLRFLRVILDTAFLYRPARPLAIAGGLCLTVAALLMATPILYYLQHRVLQEWMIYRFIVCNLLGNSGLILLSVSHLSRKVVDMTLTTRTLSDRKRTVVSAFLTRPWWLATVCALVAAGGYLVWPSFLELVRTGHTYEHWSRFVVMSSFLQIALILTVTRLFDYILDLIATRLLYLKKQTERLSHAPSQSDHASKPV